MIRRAAPALRDDVAAALAELGEDPTADRVSTLVSALREDLLLGGLVQTDIRVLVDQARRKLDQPRVHSGTFDVSSTAWPQVLGSERDIARHISGLSPYDVSEEQIEEQYRDCRARLQWVALDSFVTGDENYHLSDEERQAECDRLPAETMPPLLADGNELVDGHHRMRTLLQRDATHWWVYVIEDIPESALELSVMEYSIDPT
ncbi:hypothetical protein R70006_06238 [Paraburkholderia domus]|uniref:hypothetical protein n=1 Tax=Paraburkholderia domus TaxID=2793075 RepID=UPI00191238C3|nr:hypothetical protein [Paraburkholderia domus]MBK5052869.1 hypothetical protein [Burkholderia sp. R-70006]CAE6821819.1 hypothetical protein R70006_06238 [Paraburkholderia domus]